MVSILAVISLAISTVLSSIVAAARGAGKITPSPKPTPTPEPGKGGVTEWIQKQLSHIVNVLKKLGVAALGALPGIISSVISWIFGALSKTVGWLAYHVWALVVGVGAF